jgi:hypothetical protein
MVNLRQNQTKHKDIRAHWGKFWATKSKLTNKGWNIKAVRLIGLGEQNCC